MARPSTDFNRIRKTINEAQESNYRTEKEMLVSLLKKHRSIKQVAVYLCLSEPTVSARYKLYKIDSKASDFNRNHGKVQTAYRDLKRSIGKAAIERMTSAQLCDAMDLTMKQVNPFLLKYKIKYKKKWIRKS